MPRHVLQRVITSLDVGPFEVISHSRCRNVAVNAPDGDWQSLSAIDNDLLQVYSAHYDSRHAYVAPNARAFVQVLAMARRAILRNTRLLTTILLVPVRIL